MRRAARYLPSLLLCLSAAAATFWVRSYFTYDQLERESWSATHSVAEHRSTQLRSGRGTVYFFRTVERVQLPEPPARRPSSSVSEWTATPASQSQHPIDAPFQALHDKAPAWAKPLARLRLAYSREDKEDPNRGDWPRGSITSSRHAGSAPYWLLVAAPLAWPAVRFTRRTTHAWVGNQRRRAGLCANCGYDLRGSSGRCPECGAADTAGPSVSAATPARGASRRHALIVGSFLAACAVACLFNLRAAAGREPPSLTAEHRRLDRMVSKQVRRLIAEIRHPGSSRGGSLYYEVASFGTPEAVKFLAETYEEEKRRGPYAGYPNDGPDLIMMLWGIRRPESANVLLRMLQGGRPDLRLVDALTAVAGPEMIPELRRLADAPPNDTVRYGAPSVLLALKEPRAVRECLDGLKPCGTDPVEIQRLMGTVGRVLSARIYEAIPQLRALSAHYEPSGLLQLRQAISDALLSLGDWDSIPAAIRLLEETAVPASQQPHWLEPNVYRLRALTGEQLAAQPGPWRTWWEQKGSKITRRPWSYGSGLPPTDDVPLVKKAFLDWAKTPAGGVVPGPVVYVQGDRTRSTETIRYYREAELRLLGVPSIRIDGITIKGDTAQVSFYGPRNFCGPGPTAELTRGPHGWTVKGKTYVSEFLPAGGNVF